MNEQSPIVALREAALVAKFRDMLRIRAVEEEIAARYGAEKMRCPVHLSIGQEAVSVGVWRGYFTTLAAIELFAPNEVKAYTAQRLLLTRGEHPIREP